MRALRLVRYRRSMVVWEVLGRPLTPTPGGGCGIPALDGGVASEEVEEEEMGLPRLSLEVNEVDIGGVVGGGVDAADELEEMGVRGCWCSCCCGMVSLFEELATAIE